MLQYKRTVLGTIIYTVLGMTQKFKIVTSHIIENWSIWKQTIIFKSPKLVWFKLMGKANYNTNKWKIGSDRPNVVLLIGEGWRIAMFGQT